MASDISNNAGAGTGDQKIAGITVNRGNTSYTRHQSNLTPASGGYDGDFNGLTVISIAGISGKYDARFDDVGYYE
jgi:hypothetical protein